MNNSRNGPRRGNNGNTTLEVNVVAINNAAAPENNNPS